MSTRCSASNDATAKRKRGRQPGSKNKPKIPVANCIPHVTALNPHVLQVHAGGDVAETISAFARGCRILGVCVLSASGPIAAAVLREASPYPKTLTFQGNFNLLSFTATFLPGGSEGSLAVTLAGPHGQVVGGVVAGPVVAAGTVIVVAATFTPSAFDCFGTAPVNDTSASMLPVVGGEQGFWNSSAEKKYEADPELLEKKRLEEIDQFLDSPPAEDDVFICDSASEENYLSELENCLKNPAADVGDAFNVVGGGVEEKTTGLDLSGDSGGEGEGTRHDEQYQNLEMVVDDHFGGSLCDGCGDHFITSDAFWLSGACLPLY